MRIWTPWMKQWSEETGERARVPVLRFIDDSRNEKVMPESNEMNLFIDTHLGKKEYTPEEDSSAYGDLLKWWKWCDKELKPMIDLYKYGVNLQFDIEVHGAHAQELQKLIQILEEALVGKEYLIEDRLTLADIAIIPFVRQIMRTREGEFDFSLYPNVARWTNKIITTEWFQNEVMKKT